MMGLDLAEKATLMRDQIHRLGGFMADSEESCKRQFFDFFACKSSYFLLLFQSNEMKVWVLIVRFILA